MARIAPVSACPARRAFPVGRCNPHWRDLRPRAGTCRGVAMTNSRNKGSNAEREVAKLLFAELGMTFKRDLDQYRANDLGDLICDDPAFPFTIEVKRYAKGWICKPAWEAQVFKAAQAARKHPCIIYRYDGQQWRARVYMDAIAQAVGASAVCTVHADTDVLGFAWICREIMARNAERMGVK